VLSPDLELLARWTDTVFRIPGLNIRFGLDAIVGLIPGVGDILTSLASLYILSAANRYNVPRITLARMATNIVLDTLIGAIPFVGDLFDAFWKSNQRNVELLRRHVAAAPGAEKSLRRRDSAFVFTVIAALALLMVAAAFAAFWILSWIFTAIGNAF
jgi:NAD/NADP transhydrogenase beta subunit